MAGRTSAMGPLRDNLDAIDEVETEKVPHRRSLGSDPAVQATEKVNPAALAALSLPHNRPARADAPRGRASVLPWAVSAVVIALAGFGVYYTYQKYEIAQDELDETLRMTAAARERTADADSKIMELEAELSRTRGEFAAARKRASGKDTASLTAKLEALIPDGKGELALGSDGRLNLAFTDAALYAPGTDRLSDAGTTLLGALGTVLAEFPDEQVWVYSHAASSERERTRSATLNWELSSRRALSAVYYLQQRASVDPRRLAIVAFGAVRAGPRRARSNAARIEFVLFPRNAH